MEKFFYKKKLIGIRVRSFAPGQQSLTDSKAPLQALTIKHKAGAIITSHVHRPMARRTVILQECLVVVRGCVRVDLFAETHSVVKRVTLRPGDLFITVTGGHAITFLKPSAVYEIKNGPFVNDRVNFF